MIFCGILNCSNKDSGVALIREAEDGTLDYVAISEERLARVKFPYFSPVRSLSYCMEAFSISDMEEIDYFVYDWVGIKRWIDSTPSYRKLENDYIQTKLKIPDHKVLIAESHHMAHAASVYYPSGFDEAAILIVDGLGSNFETTSLLSAKGHDINFLDIGRFYGLGQLYTMVTKSLLCFQTGQEGKTMGLAGYGMGTPGPILDIRGKYTGCQIDYSHFMDRIPQSDILQKDLNSCSDRNDVTNDYYARIAYDVQEEIEKAFLHLASYARKKTGCRNLCLCGGVALNCLANSLIEKSGLFENIFIFPASSDSGIPFGLALWGYHQKSPNHNRIHFNNAYTGKTYSREGITNLLNDFEIHFRPAENRDVARMLAQGKIVGWLKGGSEYGPRALGHRSILTDPRKSEMKDHLNSQVKHREIYRPFAPTVLEEYAHEVFDFPGKSPFMLLAPKIHPQWKDRIPAVIHVDDTARVQTVSPLNCPHYYDLIKCFYDETGVPVILNTSFNDNGEPIVETPLDALICFMRTGIDILVLENIMVDKKDVIKDQASLISRLEKFRDDLLLSDYHKAIQKTCTGYNINEMKKYLIQEKNRSLYYRCYETFDRLQIFLESAISANKKVGVVADSEHLKYFRKIFLYRQANISLEITVEDTFDAVLEISPERLALMDVVLIGLYNTKKDFYEKLTKETELDLFILYKDLSRKIIKEYIIPHQTDAKNNFKGLEEVSFEAMRSKDWNGFFDNLKKFE